MQNKTAWMYGNETFSVGKLIGKNEWKWWIDIAYVEYKKYRFIQRQKWMKDM